MPLPEILLGLLWIGVTAYVLFGGADFGGGVWDLLAGGAERGARQRALVEHSIGPVWEANHVWLIFVIVLAWTGVPSVFAAVASTLYVPLTLTALGIIARGSAFAFRKASTLLWQRRLFGAAFAFSSVVTPFFLGTVAGAIASGRVPPGIAEGDLTASWLNPTSLVSGALAVGTAAYLAAVYLTRDAQRAGDTALAAAFRRRALAAGVVVGGLSALGLAVLRADAPRLFGQLTTGAALPLLVLSVAAGVVSLALLAWTRAYLAVRVTAALAVVGLLWGWGVGQYPHLLPGVTLHEAAATPAVLAATLGALAVGALLLVPSLVWLYATFQRGDAPGEGENGSTPVAPDVRKY
ncbi:cytochrome d ubiquinol oxidase subunit II [Streptomonospora nanhaiensis]|uniref:Cytochrome d ubiquinol oxidase subunit II n=1 Tax=Streptomonospora nanhaiensis TaxID=1323731 RepID=A0A853BTB9_9ACTN|nr:cytochrome d ubiquinol oxidase subunit II [Streptomonospora nanhaiensis]MBV2366571.1 cytochrome d ubiquinol oxidase subunit II [Streptomonospora nanhaiensis]MBX9386913.1 cytochrome d ubiquinol oxidase subunit II [Streptomonospora nanhaiensis]NYI98230.1 cytochrome d ubiquinol oxidase subunit II [Streptomonospora nanhaiensis]